MNRPRAKKLVSGLVVLIMIIALPVTLYLVQQRQQTELKAFAPDLMPRKVSITNMYGQGFTVSYITDGETIGKILYGTSSDSLDKQVEEPSMTTLHHIDVTPAGSPLGPQGEGQQPSTPPIPRTYYFKICSGTECSVSDQSHAYGVIGPPQEEYDYLFYGGEALVVALPPALDIQSKSLLQTYGTLGNHPGEPTLKGAMVRLFASDEPGQKSPLYSALFNYPTDTSSYTWAFELSNLRNSDLSDWFQNTANLDTSFVTINVYTYGGFFKSVAVPYKHPLPLTQIIADVDLFPPGSPSPNPSSSPDGSSAPGPSTFPSPSPESSSPTPNPSPSRRPPRVSPSPSASPKSLLPSLRLTLLKRSKTNTSQDLPILSLRAEGEAISIEKDRFGLLPSLAMTSGV